MENTDIQRTIELEQIKMTNKNIVMHKGDCDINISKEEDAQSEVIEQLRSPESQDSDKNIENIEMQEGGHNIKTSEPENAQIDIIERLRRSDLHEMHGGNHNSKLLKREMHRLILLNG